MNGHINDISRVTLEDVRKMGEYKFAVLYKGEPYYLCNTREGAEEVVRDEWLITGSCWR